MTAKEYLSQYQAAEREIDELLERSVLLRSRAERITPTYGSDGGGSSQPNVNKIPMIVELIIEEEERTKQRVSELIELQTEIQTAISRVPDDTCRTLLFMRYIGGKSFEAIAVSMNYSYWHLTHALHPKALQFIKVTKIPLKTT